MISPRLFILLLVAFVGLAVSTGHAQTIYEPYFFGRFAGDFPGSDDGQGNQARFYGPEAAAADKAGNIYVADYWNHSIRKITPTGQVTTLAGQPGFFNGGFADGVGPMARFYNPTGVAVDDVGDVYVADTGNNRIRKITPFGMVTTIAGGHEGSQDGPAMTAGFYYPGGVARDKNGNLFVADTLNHTIRKITPDGMVTTLAGKPGILGSVDGVGSAALFAQPNGVTLDSAGNLYVSDTNNFAIRKVTSDGVVSTVAGMLRVSGFADGAGTNARFDLPFNAAFDVAGNLFVADGGNSVIRKIDPSGNVTTVAGSPGGFGATDGSGSSARFRFPHGVVFNTAGDLFISDWENWSIRRMTPAGEVTTFVGQPGDAGYGDGTGSAAKFAAPSDVAVDEAGNVYVADAGNRVIRKITPGGVVSTLAGMPKVTGTQDGYRSEARFDWPQGIAVDKAGNVYVADTTKETIRKITPDGMVSTFAGLAATGGDADGVGSAARFRGPEGLAVDGAGNVYVIDSHNYTLRKITPGGEVTTVAGKRGNGATNMFNEPHSVAIDPLGNVFVGDGPRVCKVSENGIISTYAGSSSFFGNQDGSALDARFTGPLRIAADRSGDLYVCDVSSYRVRKISTNGMVTTLGGSTQGNAVGAGKEAFFDRLTGLAVNSAGAVYVVDTYNSTIRIGVPSPAPPQLANISTRLQIENGDYTMIAGFIVTGNKYKTVMIRALGRSLTNFNISGALSDPTLELYDDSGALIASNDNWNATQIGGYIGRQQNYDIAQSGLAPTDQLESAIEMALPAGAYTAVVRGKGGTTGVSVIEIYDFDSGRDTKMANISTRGFVQTDDKVMIGGTIIHGSAPTNVLIRAIGPSLASAGISTPLLDPMLELHDGNGVSIASNDDWRASQESEIAGTGIPPPNERESAIFVTLSPGSYTAVVRGQNNSTGIALVEVYQLR